VWCRDCGHRVEPDDPIEDGSPEIDHGGYRENDGIVSSVENARLTLV